MSEPSSNDHWQLFGHSIPKSEVVFFAQVILIYIVVITSVVNLSFGIKQDREIWISLLSGSLGYILPNPTLKKRYV